MILQLEIIVEKRNSGRQFGKSSRLFYTSFVYEKRGRSRYVWIIHLINNLGLVGN